MSMKDKSLLKIAEDKIKFSCNLLYNHLGVILNTDAIDIEINKEFDKVIPQIQEIEKNIDILPFKKYISVPQISDLIRNYLVYLLTSSVAKTDICIAKGDVLNYLIKVIEGYFPELNSDVSITSIKLFFTQLMDICIINFNESMYSEIVEIENEKPQFPFIKEFEDEYIFYNLVSKIEHTIKEDFIPVNSEFEKIKNDYTKNIKQYYQSDLIYLLGEYKFNDFYIPPVLVHGDVEQAFLKKHIFSLDIEELAILRKKWTHIFDTKDIRYIIGGAGFGKSLFLKNLINNNNKLYLDNLNNYLIIYCDLKSYYTNGNTAAKTMIDFFRESMINYTSMEGISKEFIQYYLNIGRCLILFDALDEVPKDKRNELHKKVVTFMQLNNLNNKACITSRDRGFIPRTDIEVLSIFPLIRHDINDYIDNMIALKKFKKSDKETFMKQADSLIEKGFLNNFLILSLLVNIFKAEKELPENKIELYKKCFEYIAKKREFQNSDTGYDWENIRCLMKESTFIQLSDLAAPNNKDISRERIEKLLLKEYKYKYADEATAEQAINEFLEFCANRTEVFVLSSTDDQFKFFHRSFFEYFYSKLIYQQSDVTIMYDMMSKFDIDSEVFELSVALIKEDNEGKYQKLMEYIFEQVENEFSQGQDCVVAFSILTMAMQVVDDAYFVSKYYNIIKKYSKILVKNEQLISLDQKLICEWVDKYLNNSMERQSEFNDVFSGECVHYIFKMFANPKTYNKKGFWEHRYLLSHESDTEYDIRLPIKQIPFYIILYCKYNTINDLMEDCSKLAFNDVLALSKTDWNRKSKAKVKKGYSIYCQLPIEKREKILNNISSVIKDITKSL